VTANITNVAADQRDNKKK